MREQEHQKYTTARWDGIGGTRRTGIAAGAGPRRPSAPSDGAVPAVTEPAARLPKRTSPAAGQPRRTSPAAGQSRRTSPARLRRPTAALTALAALLLAAAAADPAAAQQPAAPVPSVTVEATNSLVRNGDGGLSAVAVGRGELTLSAPRNPNTRGELKLELTAGADGALRTDLTRAWVRARFPWFAERSFHVTAGKAALTWGEGLFYNAGDVIFGTELNPGDLTGSLERNRAAWLAHAFLPTGTFSFFQPVIVVPLPNFTELADDPTAYPDATETAGGLRYQARLGNVELESGYFIDGAAEEHRPYVSVNGHLGVDLYGAVSTTVPQALYAGSSAERKAAAEDARDALTVTAGGLYNARLPRSQQLSARLEAVLRPSAEWSEQDSAAGGSGAGSGASSGGAGSQPQYALELYPELVWTLSPNFTLYARSVLSPVDLSALASPGLSWNLYDGLSLQLFASAQLGEESDTYGFDRYGGASVTGFVRYVY